MLKCQILRLEGIVVKVWNSLPDEVMSSSVKAFEAELIDAGLYVFI